MATGSFWNVDDPLKPWGLMDPDDVLNIPFDFSEWLADQGSTYASHVVTPAVGIDAVDVSATGGVVLIQVQRSVGVTLAEGQKYGVTCQVVAADGQKRSKTLYLKIKEL
ncbi:MAG: hypothetical protein K2X55_02355 [Burkholderiaceae bacterium]|nr:hypothetical protein [Burkholderiaceae bacterium]